MSPRGQRKPDAPKAAPAQGRPRMGFLSNTIVKWLVGGSVSVGAPLGGWGVYEAIKADFKGEIKSAAVEAVGSIAPPRQAVIEGAATAKKIDDKLGSIDEKLGKVVQNQAVMEESARNKNAEIDRRLSEHQKQIEKLLEIADRMRDAGANKREVERIQEELRDMQQRVAKLEAEKGK